MIKYVFLTGAYLLLSSLCVMGQRNVPQENIDAKQAGERKAEQDNLDRHRGAMEPPTQPREKTDAEEFVRNRERKRQEQEALIRQTIEPEEVKRMLALRAPHPEDVARYKEFLKQPKTGLFRLFPDFGCESKNIVRADKDCENAVSGAWSYSFRYQDYLSLDFFDIRLKDGNLIADGFLSQEILAPLGDVPLESLSLESRGLKFLDDFKPQSSFQEARRQFAQIAKVIDSDGYRYGKSVKAGLNTTYAMRIVAYRNSHRIDRLSRETMSAEEKKFWLLQADKRMDLTIAFRIIRIEHDGNVTVLWKELARRKAPKLTFKNNEKLSDIQLSN